MVSTINRAAASASLENKSNMKLAKLYDRVSASYDLTDRVIVNSQCRTFAMSQLHSHFPNFAEPLEIVDLGVGDGEFLRQLNDQYVNASFTGVDIADKMLQLAKSKLSLKTVNASLDKVDQVLPAQSYDVILAHFVLAYVELRKILRQCNTIQREHGVISLITTTFESFSHTREALFEGLKQRKLAGPMGTYFYERAINKTLVPQSFEEIKAIAEQEGYEIISRNSLFEEIFFANVDDIEAFGIKGGWFITAIDYRYVPFAALTGLARAFAKLFLKFPLKDQLNIEVVLLRKK